MRSLSAAAVFGALTLAAAGTSRADEVIVQRDKAFSQERVVIRAGDPLLFRNEDSVAHNLFSRSPGLEFEVTVQLPGQEASVTFDRPGEAEVRCAIHPQMKLQVVVKAKGEE